MDRGSLIRARTEVPAGWVPSRKDSKMKPEDGRPCPVCCSAKRRLLYRQRFIGGPMGDGYDVVVCVSCGAGYADGVPTQLEMDRYYSEQSKYTYDHSGGSESAWDMKRFEATADQIIPHLQRRDLRILDIGCATGGLLSVFKRRGFANVYGVDPSPACAEKVGQLYGIKARAATLAQLADWTERFDLILMVGVLEHLCDVRDAVEVALRLLRKGGRLYCAVPDVEGLAQCRNAPFQQFSIEHVNFFSIASLCRLMSECGMTEASSWRWKTEWREDIWEPIASGLFERGVSPMFPHDAITEAALQAYLLFSREKDKCLIAVIDSLILSHEPIVVWGAGTLARRLLVETRFAEANIVAFVDSNHQLQGSVLAGRPVWHPSRLVDCDAAILICSGSFTREIVEVIRLQYGRSNRIISLMDGDAT